MGIFSRFFSSKDKPAATSAAQGEAAASGAEAQLVRYTDDGDAVQFAERRDGERHNARENTRALIIDDSPTIVAALKRMLRSAGYVTLEAPDAEKGLEIAYSQAPEIIFLDIVLPGMNGFSALRALRRDPSTRDVPVIMISGNEQATEHFFGSAIGAEDFMKKPFSRQEVFHRIGKLLDSEGVPRRRIAGDLKTAGSA